MTPWLQVVGIGADGLAGLNEQSRHLIAAADVLIGSPRHLDLVRNPNALAITWLSPIAGTFGLIRNHEGRKCVVLASGDPLWYGIGTLLLETFGADAVRIHPTVSSMQLACVRLGWSMEQTLVVSLHGRPIESVCRHLQDHRNILVLSGPESQAAQLAYSLNAIGYTRPTIRILERLGAEDEKVVEFTGQSHDPLAILAVETGRRESGALRSWLGLPDDAYEHDGKITKAELRAAAIAKLAQAPGGKLWDIGAGSGAVGIEWLLAGAGSSAVAVERNAARAATIARNARKHGVQELSIVEGAALAVLDRLPDADAIFIGGGLSDPRLLAACVDRLEHAGCLVAHAVTLESEKTLLDAYARLGGELTRISIDRASPVGALHGWRPSMPVMQYALTKT